MSQKTINILLVSGLILLLILGVSSLVKASGTSNLPPAPSPDANPKAGLGDAFGKILGQIFSGNWFKNIFSGKDDLPSVVNCDPNRVGYDMDGTANANCGKDYTGCKVGVCDPNRLGWDECGFPDMNCGFGRTGR